MSTTKVASDPMRIIIGPVRFSYLNMFKPSAPKGSDKLQYGGSFLFSKKDKVTLDKIKAAMNAAKEKGKEKKAGWKGTIPSKLKSPLKDGDAYLEEHPNAEEYKGCWYISATNKDQPGMVVKGKDETEAVTGKDIYSGAYGKVSLSFYPYDNVSNGVGCQLNNLLKTEDGESLGGVQNIDAADEFADDIEVDEEF